MALGSAYAMEVRAHDYGWAASKDRNLLGRFSTHTFSLPRLDRTQNYFLRLYDQSSPPRYSRYPAEQIAATNTEGRIRTEVQLTELRDGQAEIKTLI